MKRFIQYTAIVIALSLAASCNPIGEGTSESGLISFEPQSVETKALINSATDLQSQKFTVKDMMGNTAYIDNYIAYNSTSSSWEYQTTPTSYPWADGTHKLFGFTYGSGSFADNTWSIPSTTLKTNLNQTDLLYSTIVNTTAADWKAAASGHTTSTPVTLKMHHLLSAVRITLVNNTGVDVTVSSVEFNLPITASTSVNFAGDDAVRATPTFPSTGSTGNFVGTFTSATLAAGESVDALSGTKVTTSTPAAAYMIWPQTLVKTETSATATLTITLGDNSDPKIVKLPAGSWKAGEINNYTLVLYPGDLELVFNVMPWEPVSVDPIDTSTGSINMSNVTWMNTKVKRTQDGEVLNTVDDDNYTVYMYKDPLVNTGTSTNPNWTQYTANNGYSPAQGYFTVNYPDKGLFKIELIPAYGQSAVPANTFKIQIYGKPSDNPNATPAQYVWRDIKATEDLEDWRERVGTNSNPVTIYFRIIAATEAPTNGAKAQINIWFKPEGGDEWISAYSEIRANYAATITN
ncbi:MAG: fimbrillin family protein [Bacteroidales bacterium]|nr:fimbrillin family protein [Bacteroidales bacterium]